jgi:hypothetical protein
MGLWYVWRKSCTYLARTPTLSPNGPKRDSTWLTSPWSSIGCAQNDFWGYGTFGTIRAPIFRQDQHYLRTDWIKLPLEYHHLGVPLGASKMIYEPKVHSSQTVHLRAWRLALSPNEVNQASTWASSPRTTIECVQNDFGACVMFSANHATILYWHQHFHQMDQNEIPQNPRHHRVPSSASKRISEAVVLLAQIVHLSCVKFSTISKRTESSIHLSLFT